MGSIFTTTPNDMDRTSIFGTKEKAPVYLQFVPGVVTEVCASIESTSLNGSTDNINSIKALPHIGAVDIKKGTMLGERYRYYPLFRGIVDVPAEGDPILLCTFGGVNYYLGPLNTENNVNKSSDFFANDQLFDDGRALSKQKKMGSKAFIPQKRARLQKFKNPKLDFPANKDLTKIQAVNSVSPDMILEGRHGNSLRIGSRNIHPYVMLSNGRQKNQPMEMSEDNSIFAMFDNGSIRDHFPFDHRPTTQQSTESTRLEFGFHSFILADSDLNTNYKSITKTFTKSIGRGLTEVGENDPNIDKTIYDYTGPQAFLNSDRITINARNESMFLSSKQFMHLGSGNTMTFSTSNNILFETKTSIISNVPVFKVNSNSCYIDGREQIVLGNPEKDRGILNSAVLGNKLQTALSMIMSDIRNLAFETSKAIEGRDATGASLETMENFSTSLEQTEELINTTILSKIVTLK